MTHLSLVTALFLERCDECASLQSKRACRFAIITQSVDVIMTDRQVLLGGYVLLKFEYSLKNGNRFFEKNIKFK